MCWDSEPELIYVCTMWYSLFFNHPAWSQDWSFQQSSELWVVCMPHISSSISFGRSFQRVNSVSKLLSQEETPKKAIWKSCIAQNIRARIPELHVDRTTVTSNYISSITYCTNSVLRVDLHQLKILNFKSIQMYHPSHLDEESRNAIMDTKVRT